jgi:hypothetical protein
MAYQKGNPLWYCRRCGMVKRLRDRRVEADTQAEVCSNCYDKPRELPRAPREPSVVHNASTEPAPNYEETQNYIDYE